MKRLLQSVILLLTIILSFGCNSETKEKKASIEKEWKKYKRAIEVKDYDVAKNYVYNIIELDSNNHTYYDTLAKLYYITKDYKSALASAKKALAFQASDQTLKIAYRSCNNLQLYNESALFGEQLLKSYSDSVELQYEIAFNYLRLYKYQIASDQLNKIIQNPKSLVKKYNEYRGDGVQTVPYKAAAYNLLGFAYNEQNNKELALQMFKMALETFPEYILAKENFNLIINQTEN